MWGDYFLSENKYVLETLVQQVRDLLVKVMNDELSQRGITSRQVAVLNVIDIIGDKPTPKEIAARMLRQPHATSNLLIRMEKQGLVRRAVNPEMKNRINVTLTEEGRQVLEDASGTGAVSEIASCLTEDELKQLIVSLKKLRDRALAKVTEMNKPLFP